MDPSAYPSYTLPSGQSSRQWKPAFIVTGGRGESLSPWVLNATVIPFSSKSLVLHLTVHNYNCTMDINRNWNVFTFKLLTLFCLFCKTRTCMYELNSNQLTVLPSSVTLYASWPSAPLNTGMQPIQIQCTSVPNRKWNACTNNKNIATNAN